MPEIRFKAFLSCSFADADKTVVDFFEAYLSSLGFDVTKYDYQEPKRLTEAVKAKIVEADCLVAVATKGKKLEDSDEWVFSPWVEHEIVFANSIAKPVAIFAEAEVSIKGIIALEERIQRFERANEKLLRLIPKFNKFVMSLRELLERQWKAGPGGQTHSPLIYRISLHARDEILSGSKTLTTCEVDMEALIDGLEYADHGFGDPDWLRPSHEAIEAFEFTPLELPTGTSARAELGYSKEYPNKWRIRFSPPLQRQHRMKYAFRYNACEAKAVFWEDAQEAIAQGKYWRKEPKCATTWNITHPTGRLRVEVVFPPKYPVHEPGIEASLGETGFPALEEMNRIQKLGGFAVERFFDRYTLRLDLTKPVRGCKYELVWRPPKRSEYPVGEHRTPA